MNTEVYREFQFLTEISSGDAVTQRRLAKKYGLALGLTNFLIRRLVKKGCIKIVNLQRKRLRYFLTPKGMAEKARLSYEYLDYSLALYRHLRTLLTHILHLIRASGGTRVALYGTGELAEIAFLLVQQHGLQIVAVVDEASAGTVFMDRPVQPVAALAGGACDFVVVASFADLERIRQRLGEAGVPAERILALSDRAPMPAASQGSLLPAIPLAEEEGALSR